MDDYLNNKSLRKRKKKKTKGKVYGILGICCAFLLLLFIGFKQLNSSNSKNVQVSKNPTTNKLASNKNVQNKSKEDSFTLDKNSNNKKDSHKTNNNDNNNNNTNSNNKETIKNKAKNNLKETNDINKQANQKNHSQKDNSNMVFADEAFHKDGQKVAFLTFDDGPSKAVTPKILDTLKKYDVKATFFVLGQLAQQNDDLLKREYNEGHSIGNHSYSHEYSNIYKSVPAFMNEFNKGNAAMKKALGNDFETQLFRFPGGSFEKRKNPFKTKLKEQGLRYIDWNASSGDAAGHNVPVQNILENIKSTTQGKNHVVILMHDASTKKTTAEALPYIIEYLKSQGYVFKTLK